MNIKDIKNDKFLKDMKINELNSLCEEIRFFIVDSVSKTGGHLSSNLGDVELTVAIHKVFYLDNDKLLFDVGHQCYTHKILNGKANEFDTLRQLDGLSGFISSEENKNDIFESGHSSTSISTAMGIATSAKANNEKYNVISLIGDASIANGVAFEALNNISNNNGKVIIILNDNDMAINSSVGAIAKSLSKVRTSKTYAKIKSGFKKLFAFSPRFINFVSRCVHRLVLIFRSDNMFDNFNISYLGIVDGHNMKALIKALNKAKNYPNSILVHVKTKKGKGYKYSSEDKLGKYHGVSPFNKETGEFYSTLKDNEVTFTSLIANKMYDILSNDLNAYLISSAMVYCCNFTNCFEKFKDRCIDVGIAEEHSIAFANGLSINNKNPYVSLYSTFMQRGYDEIVHDVCRINSNMTFLVDRAGIVGEDGKTHQGIYDVSFLYPLENSVITMVSEGKYVNPLLDCLNKYKGVKFIRYQKVVTTNESYDKDIEFGKFIYEIYNKENKVSIIAVGASCKILKEMILQKGLKINLINPIFLKPLDKDCLEKISNTKVFVYDNTSVFSGFASEVMKYYNGNNKIIKCFTLEDKYIKHGKYNDVLKYLKMDEITILNEILKDYE